MLLLDYILGLGLNEEEAPQFGNFIELKKKFIKIFLEKTQEEWCKIFDNTDACVAPVLDFNTAPKHPHNVAQNTFIQNESGEYIPNPCPILSRTPGISKAKERAPKTGEHTVQILYDLGYPSNVIEKLQNQGVIDSFTFSKL